MIVLLNIYYTIVVLALTIGAAVITIVAFGLGAYYIWLRWVQRFVVELIWDAKWYGTAWHPTGNPNPYYTGRN